MVRWLSGLAAVAAVAVFGCSSSSTNPGGGGAASGGAAGGGGASGGGSGGAATGGSGGGASACPWGECLKKINDSNCKLEAAKCLFPKDCSEIGAYAECSCDKGDNCAFPTDLVGSKLIACVAKHPVLAPLCLGVDACNIRDEACVAVGSPKCCAGLACGSAGLCQ